MPYITIKKSPKQNEQISFEEMLFGINDNKRKFLFENQNCSDTRTFITSSDYVNKLHFPINEKIQILKNFLEKYKDLYETENKSLLYHSFKIPKRSGGYRQINAPKDELMIALRELKFIFEKHLYATYHTSAFAYVKGRCTIDSIKRHKNNKSRWFLKLDFHDFFGSTTLQFVEKQLNMIYPYSEIYKIPQGKETLNKVLSLCFLNNGLPQGTPMSPLLTNIIMIPIDHQISKLMREQTPHICYTRYADDLLLSSEFNFKWSDIQSKIIEILDKFEAPFSLNTKKTRYGSNSGRNWNLGVMLNKDNEITIGHAKKKLFKTMLYQFLNDFKNQNFWDIETTQELQGQISYFKMVEKENIENIIKKYEQKFNINLKYCIKMILSNNVN